MSKNVEKNVLFLGARLTLTKKKIMAFVLLDEDFCKVGEVCAFNIKGSFIVGGVYSVSCALGKGGELESIVSETLQWNGDRVPEDELSVLLLLHEAALTEASAISQKKKALADKSSILDVLKPLRVEYQRTNPVGKLALEVRVLNYLRNNNDL